LTRAFPVGWKPSDLAPSEADIERAILRYLRHRGALAWPTHGPRSKPLVPGIPDIIGVDRHGVMIAIEVKAADGVVSEKQEDFHRELFRRGIRVIVARSLDDVTAAGL
jgi:hypothetical protein